jgi:hypothetical protein
MIATLLEASPLMRATQAPVATGLLYLEKKMKNLVINPATGPEGEILSTWRLISLPLLVMRYLANR